MAPIAMLETTPEGRVSWANDCWCELTATTSDRALEWHWFNTVHPDDLTRVMDLWQASTSQGATITIECRIVVPGRAYRLIEFRAAPLIESSTGTTTYALTAMDVTEKRNLNEMTRTTRDLETWAEQSAATLSQQGRDLGIFAALVESSADAIAIIDPNETLQYANAAFHDLFDLAVDISWSELLTTLGVDENAAHSLHSANSTGEPWQSLVTLERPRLGPLHADISSFSISRPPAIRSSSFCDLTSRMADLVVECAGSKIRACPVTRSGPRSSTRRPQPTRSAASCSRSSRER
jgi:PAS domain-containing protein